LGCPPIGIKLSTLKIKNRAYLTPKPSHRKEHKHAQADYSSS
jgi:hypothetical protein